jgi:hypothetical protein
MKISVLVVAALLLVPTLVCAQNTLNDQINAVDAAQRRQQAAEMAAQQAQRIAQEAYERRVADQQRAAAASQKQREDAVIAAQKQRQEAALTEQKRKDDEILADKRRDQSYQDKLRDLDVQQKMLAIEAEKARVARVNEYIDQDLKEKAAHTDVVQSNADATRDLSSGTKTLLEKTGEAEVKSQSGLFK